MRASPPPPAAAAAAKLSEESLDAAAWTLETVKIAMHNLDQREKRHGR